MSPLLSIKDLSIQFNHDEITSKAVDHISFDINRGETVAIVGESGSGKSVTALSFLQLLPAQGIVDGSVLFYQNDQEPVDLLRLSEKKINGIRGNCIAMVFQEPMTSLNPVFTCGQQVMEVIQRHQRLTSKTARQKAIELFEKVNLPHPTSMLGRYPHQLSGGQKQRVMIAMAMSCNPALLIADEPTTALDVTVQKTILELIASLQQQNNMGVILITHDLGVVADIADKIVVMYNGKIAEQGMAAEILHNPQHPYTKALLACRPAGKPKGVRLPVISDFMEDKENTKDPKPDTAYRINERENELISTTKEQRPAVLTVNNLCVSFPVKKNVFGKASQFINAVDDVSFTVQKGETVGLVGESGCGKTTLGRAILQLIKPSSGEIILNGKNISSIKPPALRQIRKDLQIVFQDPYGSLDPRISIGNAILEPLQVHRLLDSPKQQKEKVISLLEKVGLPVDHYNRYPHQFSGGQRQRICIARALATEPSFLIFDESVSSLDVSIQAQVLNLLSDLKNEFGFSAIFIAHDLSVVHYCCDRILVMNKGKIVEEGEAGQVFHHPQNEYSKNLVAAIPGKKLFKPSI